MIEYVVTGKIIKYFKLKAPENKRMGWKDGEGELKIHLLKESVNNQSLSKIRNIIIIIIIWPLKE